ncbi:MAG: hypothetical protein ACLUSP_08235 [Christensenellales bacterium]
MTKSDKADRVLTHKIWGIPIFLVILFGIFHLTFSENLFFLNGFTEKWAGCRRWATSDFNRGRRPD